MALGLRSAMRSGMLGIADIYVDKRGVGMEVLGV